eukprot:PITA_35378
MELQGMWDFILPDEEDQDALLVATRSRNQLDPPQSSAKKKNPSSTPKDKITGVGCVLVSPKGEKTILTCRLEFDCTNNTVEYEALVQGLYKAIGLKYPQVFGDSEIVIKRVRNTIHCLSGHLKHYQTLVQDLTSHFILRLQNASADLFANVASKLIPPKDYSPDRFLIELIFRPSILDNVTNWRVFNNDADIVSFLTSEGSYNNHIIDEDQHDKQLEQESSNNAIPKSIVRGPI